MESSTASTRPEAHKQACRICLPAAVRPASHVLAIETRAIRTVSQVAQALATWLQAL